MKKLLFFMFVFSILFAVGISLPNTLVVFADEGETSVEEELKENISSQLEDLDLSEIEKTISNIGEEEYQFFEASSFKEKLSSLISGEFSDGKSLFKSIVDLIFDDLLELVPLLTSIIAIAIICSFISSIRSNTNGKSIADIVHFVCYGIVIVLVINSVIQVISLTSSTLQSMKSQMEAIFPILLTLMTAVGGTVSVSVFQPAVALLAGGVMTLFNSVIMPIFIFSLVFSIISNLTDTVKLDKFACFFNSLFKYIVGFVFTIFIAFLSIQGITASSFDGISFRTAKFAIKSYIPLLGGYLSDGLDVIMTSSVLIKNAVGAGGLLLMFGTIIVPLLKIVLFMLSLKLAGAVLEPIADNRISSFVSSVSKSMSMLVVMILGVGFMYLISVGLLMCSANFV